MIKRVYKLFLPPAFVGILFVPQALAAEWTTSAAVAPAITYTDNVCLSSDNKKGEWIGLVTPSVGIDGKGRRANLNVTGSVEMNTLSNSDLEKRGCGSQQYNSREQFTPDVNANADAILVEDWLFIDGTLTATQNSVSPFASGGGDSLDRNGNTNTTYHYTVSPYIQRRIKDDAELTLRYTYDDQYNSADLVGDSAQESVLFELLSGTAFGQLSWGLVGNYSKTDFSNTEGRETRNSELKSAQVQLGYQINRSWQVNGFTGDEWNDFVSDENDIDGKYWDVGLRWTPNARTIVEVGHGDRFYGDSDRLLISYRHKRSSFTANYNKSLTYDRDIRTLGDPLGGGGDFGNDTLLTNNPVLDERFTLGYSYQGLYTTLDVRGSYSDQTRSGNVELADFQEATFKDVEVNVNRSISRRLSLTASASWAEQEPKDNDVDAFSSTETWVLSLGAQRRLSERMSLSFDYQYTDRQSNDQVQLGNLFGAYTENRYTLTLNINL